MTLKFQQIYLNPNINNFNNREIADGPREGSLKKIVSYKLQILALHICITKVTHFDLEVILDLLDLLMINRRFLFYHIARVEPSTGLPVVRFLITGSTRPGS